MSDAMLVRGPDGVVHRFPTGTSRNRVRAVFEQHYGDQINAPEQPAKPPPPTVSTGGRLGAAARSALQGLTFGAGDEIVARGVSLFPGRDYDTELARERQRLEQGREEHPVSSLGSEIAGAALTGFATGAGPVAAQATLPGRIATGMSVGAIEGGLYGFGAGEGGFSNREDNARRGVVVGGAAGAALPAIVRALQAGGSAIVNPVAGALNLGNETRAAHSIVRALQRSRRSAEDVGGALRLASDDGQPMAVADALGIDGQRALAGVARQPGPARRLATDFLDQRQIDQRDRIASFLGDAFPSPQINSDVPVPLSSPFLRSSTAQTTEGLQSRLRGLRSEIADARYTEARRSSGLANVDDAVSFIDERIGPMQGSGITGDSIDADLRRFRARLISSSPEAFGDDVTRVTMSDFDRLLGVKQDVQDAGSRAARRGENNRARVLRQLEARLDQALEAASPAYRQANDSFRDISRVIDSVDQGAQSNRLGVRAEDALFSYSHLTPEQQIGFRYGFSEPALRQVENARPGANTAPPLQTSRFRDVADEIAQNPDQLRRRVDREATMFETRRQAIGGSQTADNQADQLAVNTEDMGALGNLLQGRPLTAAGQVARRFVSSATGTNEGTRELIARALLARTDAPIREAIERTAGNARVQQMITDALMRRAAQVSAYGPTGVR